MLQLGLDTFYWNPIQHVFLWGSILAWFVVLPITSSSAFYIAGIGIFRFDFLGVFYEVLATSTFWFYFPLAAIIALGPTITFRTLLLDLRPTLVDDVRLKMKKEGRKSFRRALLKIKPPRINISLSSVRERTGYAFSHQGGFGKLILSGKMFGGQTEEQVRQERERRISIIFPSSRPTSQNVDEDPNLTVHSEPTETTLKVHENVNAPTSEASTTHPPQEAPGVQPETLELDNSLMMDQRAEETSEAAT